MSSSANINPADVVLSPMRVKFGNTPVDLGGTIGGVALGFTSKMTDIKFDQLGDTPVDSVVSGQGYTVKFTIAEPKNKDNWKIAFPFAKKITSGLNKAIYMDAQVGIHLYPLAENLLLHPLENDDADLAGDFFFWKAICTEVAEVKYGSEEQTGLECTFKVFPDRTSFPARFFIHGNPALGLVAASAAAAVAGGGNVGNGTVTGVTLGSAAKTETITLTCIDEGANSGEFHVVGSVSGSLGIATVAAPFLSSVINLTINDGATDFAEADSFTIAVTGPNYA